MENLGLDLELMANRFIGIKEILEIIIFQRTCWFIQIKYQS